MPLFRCTDCGFVTTASLVNALAAHEQGSPECAGQVEVIADFTRSPAGLGSGRPTPAAWGFVAGSRRGLGRPRRDRAYPASRLTARSRR